MVYAGAYKTVHGEYGWYGGSRATSLSKWTTAWLERTCRQPQGFRSRSIETTFEISEASVYIRAVGKSAREHQPPAMSGAVRQDKELLKVNRIASAINPWSRRRRTKPRRPFRRYLAGELTIGIWANTERPGNPAGVTRGQANAFA